MSTPEPSFVAFVGSRCLAEGPLADVLPVLARRHAKDPSELALVFDVESGRAVDFDLREPIEQLLARQRPDTAPRGPGRPRLGVVSREVSLLPRHWDWLEAQPNGISAALRRLVEQAMKAAPGRDRARRIRAATSQVLTAIAGDRPGYEEACRALFAGDVEAFEAHVARWPQDIRGFALRRAKEAAAAERSDRAHAGREREEEAS